MFVIVSTIKPPRPENAQKVIMETMKIIYKSEKQDEYEIKPTVSRTSILKGIISIFYLIVFVLVYGLIIWGLRALNFSAPSIVIFIILKAEKEAEELIYGFSKEERKRPIKKIERVKNAKNEEVAR